MNAKPPVSLVRSAVTALPGFATVAPILVALVLSLSACRPDDELDEDEDLVLPQRHAAVLIDGCSLDSEQNATLRGEAARGVLSEVVLLCLSLDDQGQVSPREGDATALRSTIAALRQLGYSVGLGVTAVDSDDDEQPKEEISAWLARLAWRLRSVNELASYAAQADSLQIALPEVLNSSRADLTTWVSALSQRLRPTGKIGLFIPPSSQDPSDQSGGDAYDLAALLPRVDRLRALSVEAASGEAPGATFDADWVAQVGKFALARVPAAKLDVSVPLYGVDFQLLPGGGRQIGEESTLSHSEAVALAKRYSRTPEGESGEARHFAYTDGTNNAHEVWYEDSDSILQGLAALPTDTLPQAVGVVFVGLGGEDAQLWPDLLDALADETAGAPAALSGRDYSRAAPLQ